MKDNPGLNNAIALSSKTVFSLLIITLFTGLIFPQEAHAESLWRTQTSDDRGVNGGISEPMGSILFIFGTSSRPVIPNGAGLKVYRLNGSNRTLVFDFNVGGTLSGNRFVRDLPAGNYAVEPEQISGWSH